MIQILKGDLAGLDFDIIINQANTEWLPGAGSNGRIFQKAGTGLIAECARYAPGKPGDTLITNPYQLLCKTLIHVITPVRATGSLQEKEDLRAAWWNSLSAAYGWMMEQGLEQVSVGLPALGTGTYGFGSDEAAAIARDITRRLRVQYPETCRMNLYIITSRDEDYTAFKDAFA